MKYYLEDAYEYDFLLIGISCHEKDYRISWALNQNLSLQLVKDKEDIEVLINKTNETDLSGFYLVYRGSTNLEKKGWYGISHLLEHLKCPFDAPKKIHLLIQNYDTFLLLTFFLIVVFSF